MKKLVVKIGGAAVDSPEILAQCASAVATLVAEGNKVAVVHGGGAALTRTLKQLGITSEFVQGLRVTDSETRDVALMVLAGLMNKALVASLGRCGQAAVGISGGDGLAFRARRKKVAGNENGFVGEIAAVDGRWIESIWSMGAVPVISSLALGFDGEYYNINADEMASACAAACNANALIFLTDVAGVKGEDGEVIRWLTAQTIQELRERAVVSGGMLPKLLACEQALRGGVGRVRILPANQVNVLPEFYHSRINLGTEVVA
jgi:acetylglutamate kinase